MNYFTHHPKPCEFTVYETSLYEGHFSKCEFWSEDAEPIRLPDFDVTPEYSEESGLTLRFENSREELEEYTRMRYGMELDEVLKELEVSQVYFEGELDTTHKGPADHNPLNLTLNDDRSLGCTHCAMRLKKHIREVIAQHPELDDTEIESYDLGDNRYKVVVYFRGYNIREVYKYISRNEMLSWKGAVAQFDYLPEVADDVQERYLFARYDAIVAKENRPAWLEDFLGVWDELLGSEVPVGTC